MQHQERNEAEQQITEREFREQRRYPNRLRQARVEHGMEPYDVAVLIRRDASMVFRYEAGRTPVPEHVWRVLADEWGLTVDYLMRRGPRA